MKILYWLYWFVSDYRSISRLLAREDEPQYFCAANIITFLALYEKREIYTVYHIQGGHWVHIIDHLLTTFKISLRLLYFAKFLEFSFQLN